MYRKFLGYIVSAAVLGAAALAHGATTPQAPAPQAPACSVSVTQALAKIHAANDAAGVVIASHIFRDPGDVTRIIGFFRAKTNAPADLVKSTTVVFLVNEAEEDAPVIAIFAIGECVQYFVRLPASTYHAWQNEYARGKA